ncbi:peptidoglycan-binding protein [Acetobacteraceae bacterium KSS8]|uniref:Peptidoglycan-binding protein n=1 Tax=Endosaccharibacter trunci TaxID=2812733 RepID=A0ABT1W3S8_9PROT|nr:peptidoglycan-binding protein [Acetobacteraceae bacterium KSS8]
MTARLARLGALALASLAAVPASAGDIPIGPSFACPVPDDPLGQLVCKLPSLARADLALVQTFQALRMQAPARRAALTMEVASFSRRLRTQCKIADAALPPISAADCIAHLYATQRATWLAPLAGPAREEAERPLEQQLAAQKALVTLGLLDGSTRIDGVYSAPTRRAIIAFQQTEALPVTGLLGDRDAALLTDRAGKAAIRQAEPVATIRPVPFEQRPGWRNLQTSLASSGLNATAEIGQTCTIHVALRDPKTLAAVSQRSTSDSNANAFDIAIHYLSGPIATLVVHAAYGDQDAKLDRCRFAFNAFTRDLYGRDQEKPLFAFGFDRALFDRINWTAFDPANLPRVAQDFAIDDDAGKQMASNAKPQDDTRMASWSGNATLTTRPFHPNGPWELQWRSEGAFTAVLHQIRSGTDKIVAQSDTAGSSSAYQPEGGDFFLEFDGTKPWQARIVAVTSN